MARFTIDENHFSVTADHFEALELEWKIKTAHRREEIIGTVRGNVQELMREFIGRSITINAAAELEARLRASVRNFEDHGDVAEADRVAQLIKVEVVDSVHGERQFNVTVPEYAKHITLLLEGAGDIKR